MPTKTVEYTEEVTRKEEITICSDCGREVDEMGDHLEGDIIDLDLCCDCVTDYEDEAYLDEFVERVEEWYDTTDVAGDSMLKNLKFVRIFSASVFLITLVFGLANALIPMVQYQSMVPVLCYLMVLIFSGYSFVCAGSLEDPEKVFDTST